MVRADARGFGKNTKNLKAEMEMNRETGKNPPKILLTEQRRRGLI